MNKDNIRLEINKCNDQIIKNINEANRLSCKISEFNELKNVFNESRDDMMDFRIDIFNNSKNSTSNTIRSARFLVQIYNDIISFFKGKEVKTESNFVDNCINKYDREIKIKKNKINELKRRNQVLHNRINSLTELLTTNIDNVDRNLFGYGDYSINTY